METHGDRLRHRQVHEREVKEPAAEDLVRGRVRVRVRVRVQGAAGGAGRAPAGRGAAQDHQLTTTILTTTCYDYTHRPAPLTYYGYTHQVVARP